MHNKFITTSDVTAETLQTTSTDRVFDVSPDSYAINEARFDELEAELINLVAEASETEHEIVTVVVPWDSKFAGIGHMSETIAYKGYDNHEAMMPYERRSIWLYTIDRSLGVVEHVKRLVKPLSLTDRNETDLTGIEVVDDRLTATDQEEFASLDSVLDAHNISDIEKSWNVTSNHVTGRGTKDQLTSARNTLKSYKATYMLAMDAGLECVFAYLNRQAVKSLGRIGLDYSLLMDGEYHLPEPGKPGEYDQHYTAVVIPNSPQNDEVFTVQYEPSPELADNEREQIRAFVSSIAIEAVPIYSLSDDDNPKVARKL